MTQKYPQHLASSLKGTEFPAKTMVELLLQHAESFPDKQVYILLEDGINEKDSITYAGMVNKAKIIASVLQKKGRKGERVILLFPTGIDFITSFYACFFAGMIAVPSYPPKRNKANERFNSIVKDSTPSFILTTESIRDEILKHDMLTDLPEIDHLLVYEEVQDGKAELWKDPELSPEDHALLQYTSGSTGTPNGVIVSHGNIIHNSEFIKQSFGLKEDSVGVNWLPNFHDMGLIGCLIEAAYIGGCNVIIPPMAFLKNPSNWYKSITKYKATTGGGPNFAYDYSIEKVADEELSSFDLSSMQTTYCGSEPIREESMRNFAEKFKSANFKASQLYPVYGMAEAVLIVSGGDYKAEPIYLSIDARALEEGKHLPAENNKESRNLTACGYPWLGMHIAIIDPKSKTPSPANTIGEIWVKGPSVAKGYWNDKQGTEYTFNAFISGTDDGPWLRTGDLGFIHEGQLYVSGRIKDLIIIRGANYFPNDIELSIENAHEALRKNASAVFSADIDGEEKLFVVAEVERTFMRELPEDDVFEAIRETLFAEHGIQAHAIGLIRTGSSLKTSSGKIQRFAMKKAWFSDELNIVASRVMKPKKDKPETSIGFRPEFLREWIINWMAHELEIDPAKINTDKPVSAYGLDSITAVSLERDVNKQFGVEWPIESFLKENSVNQLVLEGIELLRRKNLKPKP